MRRALERALRERARDAARVDARAVLARCEASSARDAASSARARLARATTTTRAMASDARGRDAAVLAFARVRGFAASARAETETTSTRDDEGDDEGDGDDETTVNSKREQMRDERNFNAPNALCVGRIVAGPALAYGVASGASPELVLGGVAAAAFTDYLDGFLARRWKQGTILGSYLDPIADKVFVGCVGTALALEGSLPVWLVGLLVSRDAIHVVGGAWRRAGALGWKWKTVGEFLGFDDKPVSRPPPTGAAALAGFDFDEVEQLGSKRGALRPLFIGKVNTALQMALITFAVSEPVFAAHAGSPMMAPALELVADRTVRVILEYATAASAVVATAEYTRIFLAHPGFDADGQIKVRKK
jgi:cardiolipin synthase|tara:strand:- start:1009 stop:2094 length:1086 start_codon:yes stop_codon:yes gene_type:complete